MNAQLSPREVYLGQLGLGGSDKKAAREAALNRAHTVRAFEIELYWKRANYFWLLQAAVFAAVGLTWKADGSVLPAALPVVLASLGAITAYAGWLATQGSKFWQRNWEHHIDMLEKEFEGNLYKVVYVNRAGVKWSLTGISESLAMCFTVFWAVVLILISFSTNSQWDLHPTHLSAPNLLEIETIVCWAFTAFGIWTLHRQVTGIKGDITPYSEVELPAGNSLGQPRLSSGKLATQFLVRREPGIK